VWPREPTLRAGRGPDIRWLELLPLAWSGAHCRVFQLVRSRRLELPRVAPQRPQRCASTNSATTARGEARGLAEASGFLKPAQERAAEGPETPRPRIAVLVDREGLGDVMLKAPFLRELRKAFPAHDVWWSATHQTAMADQLRPMFEADVAQVMSHAALDGPARPLLQRMRALGTFDKVFDARSKISTVGLARLGLRHNRFYCCLPGHLFCDGDRALAGRRPKHIARRMLSMIACATGRQPEVSPWLEASAEAREEAAGLLPAGPTYVGIAPGSRQADKNWPIERFCAVARRLTDEGLTPVFLLGPQEPETQARIAALEPDALTLNAPTEERRPGESLDRLVARGERLSALLANDNGVGHLLGAAGVPVVSLFGPTDPRKWAPVAPANVIVEARSFGGSNDMAAIPADAAFGAVLSILEMKRQRP
jgi:ADP-heptose:LPS heptosyltransferase